MRSPDLINPSDQNSGFKWAALLSLSLLTSLSLRSTENNGDTLAGDGEILDALLLNDAVSISSLILHFISFFILSVTIELAFPKLRSKAYFSKSRLVLIALLVAVEITQAFVPGRHPHVADLIARIGALFAGHVIIQRTTITSLKRTPRPHLINALLWSRRLITFTLSAGWILFATNHLRTVQPLDWNPNYSLSIGNEATKNRPWEGQIEEILLEARPLPTSSKKQPSESVRLHTSELASNRTNPFKTSGNVEITDNFIELKEENSIIQVKPITNLYEAINNNNSFQLTAKIKPNNLTQSGPARIVSLAPHTKQRNLTLGQENADYHIRIQNKNTGSEDLSQELILKQAATTNWQAIRLLYHQSKIKIWIDDKLVLYRDLLNYPQHLGLGPGQMGIAHWVFLLAVLFCKPTHNPNSQTSLALKGTLPAVLSILIIYSLPILLTSNNQETTETVSRIVSCLPWVLGIVLSLYPALRKAGY